MLDQAENTEVVAAEPGYARRLQAARETLARARAGLSEGVVQNDPLAVADAVTTASNVITEASELERELGREKSRLIALRATLTPVDISTPTPVSAPTQPPSAAPTLAPTVGVPGSERDTVPPSLRRAAELFLSGEYGQVISNLEEHPSDPEAKATAHLLRGAARWALFRLGAGTDEQLRATAAADLRECHRLDAGVTPAGNLFSPAFEQFFQTAIEDAPP
jgi:hypothetical protein